MSNPCIGVVLAGGLSSRMGRDKAELELNGTTMLQHTCQLLQQAGCSQVIVSRNKGQGNIADVISEVGPLGGLYSVLKTLQQPSDILVCPVDMPLLNEVDLQQLISTGRQHTEAVYFDDCFLPLYLPRHSGYIDYLYQNLYHDGKRSVKAFLAAFKAQSITSVDQRRLINTNTPQQWQASQLAIVPSVVE